MIAIFLGPPGVGKGTQAEAAAKAHGWTHVSTGALLREELANGSELGVKANEYMSRGDLVPDEVMVEMVVSRVNQLGENEVMLLDGFPRTIAQAEELNDKAPSGSIRVAVYYTASDGTLVSRLTGRGREDDKLDVAQHRLKVYRELTAPLVAWYRDLGILCEINAERSIEEIHADTVASIRGSLSPSTPGS
ncbi:MAG: adenylate kinase [Planctomycetota bacterium]|nr:MAG: adenylate kinase [Planctomycetota bacterium]